MIAARAAVLALAAFGGLACGEAYSPPEPLRVTVTATGLEDEVATAVPAGAGRVWTVAHVLAGARSVRVAGRPARVLRVDRRLDLAVLGVDGLRGARPHYGRAGGPAVVHVLRRGRPVRIAARLQRRVSAAVREPQSGRTDVRPALELRAAVVPGDSGAPVTDARGRLVGMIFARALDGPETAWALDVGGF
jgi:S1-C subfamily serine protease